MSSGIRATQVGPRTRSVNELISEVADFVSLPDSARGRQMAHDAIRAAVRRLNLRDWWWTRESHDLTLVQGQTVYPLMIDYKRSIVGFGINDKDSPETKAMARFAYLSPDEFDAALGLRSRFSMNGGIYRTVFTVENPLTHLQLRFPDTMAKTLQSNWKYFRHTYYRNIMIPENHEDPIYVPSSAEAFIVDYAQWKMARKFDQELVRDSRTAYIETWGEMRRDNANQHSMTPVIFRV